MLKKPLIFILSLVLTFCAVGAISVMAEKSDDDVAYPAEGGNIYFNPETGEITDCDKTVTGVEIPEEINGRAVESVGRGAFIYCEALKKASLPGVKSVGEGAFAYCVDLEDISMPNAVVIGESAFAYCRSLEKIDLPKAEKIGEGSFDGCYFLKSVNLPCAVSIESAAFFFDHALAEVNMPKVESLGERAFYNCAMKDVYLPKSLAKIGESAFGACYNLLNIEVDAENANFTSEGGVLFDKDKTELIVYPAKKTETSYTVPESVESLAYRAFENCDTLVEVDAQNVVRCGNQAFIECESLEKVSFSESLAYIADEAFIKCGALKKIEVDAENASFTSEDGILFNKNKTELAIYPMGKTETSYTTPETVTKIRNRAFSECAFLESVDLPNVESIGDTAFFACYSLKSVSMPKCAKVGESAFSGCSSLKEMSMPSVTEIGMDAFMECYALKRLFLPKSLSCVGSNALCYSDDLTDIYYGGSEDDRKNIDVEYNNPNLTSALWHYDASPLISVVVNGAALDLKDAPIIENGRTLVPMRAIFEALGASLEWDGETRTATAEKDDLAVSVTVDSDIMLSSGVEKKLDCTPKLVNDRIFVPARAIAEAFGNTVLWDDNAKRVIIN